MLEINRKVKQVTAQLNTGGGKITPNDALSPGGISSVLLPCGILTETLLYRHPLLNSLNID